MAPAIEAQYALAVGTEGATVGARINPKLWEDTTYYLQYGTHPCSEGGCTEQPAPPGAQLGGGAVEEGIATPGISLAGLAPATTYHYRYVAVSSGGGPVYGTGANKNHPEGEEATFRTYAPPEAPNTDCANQSFRSGASAALPDCRAYEMVSPVDKEGGDIAGKPRVAHLDQSALSGDAITYSSYRAFGGALSAPSASQYIATRQAGDTWRSEPVSPPQEGENLLPNIEFLQVQSPFRAFSPELGTGWLATYTEPVLGEGGLAGHAEPLPARELRRGLPGLHDRGAGGGGRGNRRPRPAGGRRRPGPRGVPQPATS